jgi:transposase
MAKINESPKRRHPNYDQIKLRRLFLSGMSYLQMSDYFGVSTSTVCRWCNELKLYRSEHFQTDTSNNSNYKRGETCTDTRREMERIRPAQALLNRWPVITGDDI